MSCFTPHNEAVIIAAQWAADQTQLPQPAVDELRRRFDLTIDEALEAEAMARRFKLCRVAFG